MRLEYTAPNSPPVDLFDNDLGVWVEQDTIEGFVAQIEDNPITTVGVPGARVDPRDRTIAQMRGAFTLVVATPEQWAKARTWFSTTTVGLLSLTHSGRSLATLVRLASPLAFPPSVPTAGARIRVELVADAGLWFERHEQRGNTLQLDNDGPVACAPYLYLDHTDAGTLRLPSRLELPIPQARQREQGWLSLAARDYGAVFKQPPQQYPRELLTGRTAQLRAARFVGEDTQPGDRHTYTFTPTSTTTTLWRWYIGRFDPWT